MSNSKGSNVLLTLDDVRAWKREREMAAARILELDKKLTAVAAFMPEEARLEVFGTLHIPGAPKVRDEKVVVGKFVTDLLEKDLRFHTIQEVEGVAKNSDIADLLVANPGIVAEVLTNSARHGRLRKRGDLFCHPSFEEAEKSPNVENPDYGAADYFRGIVLAEAAKRSLGMTTAEVVSIIKADPRGRQKIEGNVQYPYSLIGRMISKEFLIKMNGRLYHPQRAPVEHGQSSTEQSEKAADPEDQAALTSKSPAELTTLPFPALAAE